MPIRRLPLLAAACLIAAACDIPTELPIVEQRWVLPLEEIVLEQEQLLPSQVSIVDGAYDVSIDPITASETLGDLCPVCITGPTISTPPFQGSFTTTDALPADVIDVSLVAGAVDISITNDLSFDPIAGGGSLTVTLADDDLGTVIGTFVLQSPADALAPGSTVMRTLDVGTGTVTGAIRTTIAVDSPGGQTATLDTSDEISLTAVTDSFRVSSATVDVAGLTASLTEEELDTDDLGDDLVDNIQNGTVVLDVTNPFSLTFDGTITVGLVTKAVFIPAAATSTVSISYTGEELRSFVGVEGVTLSGSGSIGGGPAFLSPAATLSIDPEIDVIIELGG